MYMISSGGKKSNMHLAIVVHMVHFLMFLWSFSDIWSPLTLDLNFAFADKVTLILSVMIRNTA